ncbi:MAG TPA: exodeoxyribonuclease VII large subunit [Candidatus Eisenbergiella pullistercoris]|uniref:Exodeoxyribonuclease 7 large subunit n=1 Tax=Candidatus Eisenbergiella pullistercoris TaxID=2838555 RepID=A0A9D1YT43_9FIRM|nr:exodeoxyribonuclease VII large subunit [Candidatus Eisenbergiella pullistercoris]
MKNVYSVGQVNAYIRNMFSQDFLLRSISVRGEVSNCKYHSSGHLYFTLKDERAAVACVMFAGYRKRLSFRLEEGMQVVVQGSVEVYERDGKYQLYAKEILLDGAGYLYEKFERLKRSLEERGLFAPEYKRPIPAYIRTLGVVTAPTGAAVRDIINITRRRNPYVQIILYPAVVQGDQAVPSIVNGIRALERLGVDVMIVGRGGGSMEDLWAFNEEAVAQAVFDCAVPVISAVGHETDTTIIDFVSDLRAPTPSAAAELAVYDVRQLLEFLEDRKEGLNRRLRAVLNRDRLRLQHAARSLQHLSPANRIRERRMTCIRLEEGLQAAMKRVLELGRNRLRLYAETLKGLSPLDKLAQGFSHVEDEAGRTVSDIGRIAPGDLLSIYVKNGRALAEVKETSPWSPQEVGKGERDAG